MSAPRSDVGSGPGTARHRRRARAAAPARGAALLLAMVILTLVATLAAGMVWQQSRAVSIEAAERARTQAAWILAGALDWARLILREDARGRPVDHLGEPWATPLAEARLSSFLAADRDNNADADLDAFMSGSIEDAQARLNLRNLIDLEGKPVEADVLGLQRLCEAAGVPSDTATRLAEGLRRAWSVLPGGTDAAPAPLVPRKVSQLVWLGLDPAVVRRLEPYVILLPQRTPVNANTAPREVLMAALPGLDGGSAERIVQQRQRQPFETIEQLRAAMPPNVQADETRIGVRSSHFLIHGRIRLEDRVLEEHSLVERRPAERGGEVIVLTRERMSLQIGG